MSLVATDQVGNPLNANIVSSLTLSEGCFGEGQHTQIARRNCTDLTFNVFSPHDSEKIMLFADGPCRNSAPSMHHMNIQFLNCTCPIGFEMSTNRLSECECICDSKLSPYITNCNHSTESLLLRENINAWIGYSNDTDPPGYVIHPNCPTVLTIAYLLPSMLASISMFLMEQTHNVLTIVQECCVDRVRNTSASLWVVHTAYLAIVTGL